MKYEDQNQIKYKIWRKIAILTVIILFAIPSITLAEDRIEPNVLENEPWHYIEQGPIYTAIDPYGNEIEKQTKIIWKPIYEIQPDNTPIEVFENYIIEKQRSREQNSDEDNYNILDSGSRGDFNVVFHIDETVPPEAETALDEVETYLEGIYDDDVTLRVRIDFNDTMSMGTLGSTGNYVTTSSYSGTRGYLEVFKDEDDYIQDYLPPGISIPVRYNGQSSTVTYEEDCFVAWGNFGALGHDISEGVAADTSFNALVSWDYDPSDGIDSQKYCFQSVAVHEIGHALGFVSRAEDFYQPNSDIYVMDIYRFQRTDGTGDYNPDTVEEFQTTPRLVDYNTPNDDHNSNIFYYDGSDVQYRMADGSPDQASHFRPGVNGIMAPHLAAGQTDYPNFFKTADLDIFDAIGWDYVNPGGPDPDFYADPLSGMLPLPVNFYDQSSGTIHNRLWDFGDGNTSTAANPSHTYYNGGRYDVTLSTCWSHGCVNLTKPEYILAADDFMQINYSIGTPDQDGKIIYVYGQWTIPISGYGFTFYYDNENIEIWNVTLEGTDFEESMLLIWEPTPEFNYTGVGVVYSLIESIPPGSGLLCKILVNISETAPHGLYDLDLTKDVGAGCTYTHELGYEIFPLLFDGILNVTDAPFFLRGDVDSSYVIEMGDALYLLKHLYVPGSPAPPCMDAADADDSGDLAMADAVYILKWLYVPGSPEPPSPGPYTCGPDPTTEDLLDCGYHPCSG